MKDTDPTMTNFYEKSFRLDPLMTAGYSATIILSKSRTYSQSIFIKYDTQQFLVELGGGIFMLWLLEMLAMKLFRMCLQYKDSKLLSSVYRMNANETISVDKELQPVLSVQMNAMPKQTLTDKIAGGLRARIGDILTA